MKSVGESETKLFSLVLELYFIFRLDEPALWMDGPATGYPGHLPLDEPHLKIPLPRPFFIFLPSPTQPLEAHWRRKRPRCHTPLVAAPPHRQALPPPVVLEGVTVLETDVTHAIISSA